MARTIAVTAVAVLLGYGVYGDEATTERGQVYYWIWWRNLEGSWQELIDFASDQQVDGVVMWGLGGWREDNGRCREVVQYAHDRQVKVLHGLGLNGYDVGKHIVSRWPHLAATIPEHLAETKKGRWSREAIFCPSKPESLERLRACLMQAAETGVDGFNFETADVDYITCHCPKCEARYNHADETEDQGKPVEWPLDLLSFAADALLESHPQVWLTCEFAMQRFGDPPYTDCERILELNRRIDPRMTLVWSEATAPPQEIADMLRRERENVGFYVRSGAIHGWDAKEVLSAEALLPIARRLHDLDPVCLMYRSYRPLSRYAVAMGAAARILRQPDLSTADLDRALAEMRRLTEPGGPYSFVKRVAPGNLLSPTGPVTLTVSSGQVLGERLVDGVAEPGDGIWRTERNDPERAWAVAEWPEPVAVSRIRFYHQMDGEYRALDYTVQFEQDGEWRDLPGFPVKDNPVHGWSDHHFPPVTTAKLRLLITRSMHGNRMAMGEWEAYGPEADQPAGTAP